MAHPTDTPSGPAIAARIQRGDREAFAALVERFHDLVHAVALARALGVTPCPETLLLDTIVVVPRERS